MSHWTAIAAFILVAIGSVGTEAYYFHRRSASAPIAETAQQSAAHGATLIETLETAAFDTDCTDCFLIVGLITQDSGVSAQSCTFNAGAMNDVVLNDVNSSTELYMVGERITSANATVSCSWTGDSKACILAIALENVDQTTPTNFSGTANGSTIGSTITATGSEDGDYVVDMLGRFSATANPITVGTNQVEDFNIVTEAASSNARCVASHEAATGASTVMTQDWADTARAWAAGVMSVNPL